MAPPSLRWSDKPLPIPMPESDESLSNVRDVAELQQPGAPPTPGMRNWLFGEGKKVVKRLHKEYSGGRGFNGQYSFRRPSKPLNVDLEKDILFAGTAKPSDTGKVAGKYPYLNAMGQTVYKLQDVDVYLSTTTYAPRRLMVQAAPHVFTDPFLVNTDWRRRAVKGSVPTVLRMAEWALRPGDRNPDTGKRSPWGVFVRIGRLLLVGIPLQFMLAFPGSDTPWEEGVEDNFIDYPGYHWQWPKHTVNPLDQKPGGYKAKPSSKPLKISSRSRLTRPRRLVVYRGDDRWKTIENPSTDLLYIFISFTTQHFPINGSEEARRALEKMAAYVTLKEGCTAFWLDYRCCASAEFPDQKTADINRICDVIRSAHQVVVMLPDQRNKPDPKSQEELLQEWGRRMWTLPEGLLTPSDMRFCHIEDDGSFGMFTLQKLELTDRIWKDDLSELEDPPTRILAEHYAGTLTLGRLEFLQIALTALCDREASTNLYTDADLAYALMGLLHHRIEPDSTDSLFQALARLSLANDSDRLIERMICMSPRPYENFRKLFESLTKKDQFETHLWDIHPLAEVVGVGDEPNTVLINNCKAIPIRWKQFPRMKYSRHQGMKKLFAEMFVRSGAWWFLSGVGLAWTYAPILLANSAEGSGYTGRLTIYLAILICAFIAVGFLLSAFGPHSVRRLFGGAILQTSPWLVAFEGVMPIRDLESIMFGNFNHRMSYEASSTPFILHHRNPDRREGIEPPWIRQDPSKPDIPIPPGHRLFTLVDTNSLTVSVFTAQRPPTVAVICGREGGMLRTVLCSWRFSMDCLFREAVVRLPSDTWDIAKMPGWLKLSLGNQEDMLEGVRWQREELWRKRAGARAGHSLSFGATSNTNSYQKPPLVTQSSYQKPPTQSKPPQVQHSYSQPAVSVRQSQSPLSPPISAYSPQARHRTSSGARQNSSPLYSSPLKTSHSPHQNTDAQSTSVLRPSPQPGLHHTSTAPSRPAIDTTLSSGAAGADDQPFYTPPTTHGPYQPPTFLAPITPTAPLSGPPSRSSSTNQLPTSSVPALPTPPAPGAHAPHSTPAGAASPGISSPSPHPTYNHPYEQLQQPQYQGVVTGPSPSPGDSVSPENSSRHDSVSPHPSGPSQAPQQAQQPHRAPSPGGAGLLRPAAPNREWSSPALEPGRVEIEGSGVQAVELEAPPSR